jgi:hypothetical protein
LPLIGPPGPLIDGDKQLAIAETRVVSVLAGIALLLPAAAMAGEILDKPPRNPDPDTNFVFTLANQGLTVISERRKKGTDRKKYGAFYLPDDAWVLPVVNWIKTAN